jgi:hypothetical protein
MIGKLIQLQGTPVIRGGEIKGDFYSWPEVETQLNVFGIGVEGSMRHVETARVRTIDNRDTGMVTFTCIDGGQFSLEKVSNGSMIMENGGLG